MLGKMRSVAELFGQVGDVALEPLEGFDDASFSIPVEEK